MSVDTLHFYVRRLRSKLANFNIFGTRGLATAYQEMMEQTPIKK